MRTFIFNRIVYIVMYFRNIILINLVKIIKFMLDTRVTYRRRKSYNTKTNKIRKVKTPGGRLVV